MRFNLSHQSYGSTASPAMAASKARYAKRAEAAERMQAIACGPPSSGNPPCPVDLPPIPRGEPGTMVQDAPPDPWAAERRKYQQEWAAYLNRMVELPDGQWNPPPHRRQLPSGGRSSIDATGIIVVGVLGLAAYGIYSLVRSK